MAVVEEHMKDVSSDDADSKSEDESEEEDEHAEEAVLKEVQWYEEQLAASPADYQTHVKFISLLRKAGLLEKLRAAREAMNVLYPLTAAMWLEWTQDETRLISKPEDVANVEALFERGVHEYLSVPLWLAYLRFLEQHKATDPAALRALYENALTCCGLHLTEGPKLWRACIELEKGLLAKLQDTDDADAADKQAERVCSLYRRQLAVPLASMEDTLAEYTEWEEEQGRGGKEGKELPGNVRALYVKALAMSVAREEQEKSVAAGKEADADLLNGYLTYIALEERTKEPARVQIIYERAIASFPVTHDLWLRYTSYLDTNLKVPSVITDVYARAVRNCPWVGALWSSYLLALERISAATPALSSVFEAALQGGIQTPQEYMDVFLTRVDGLRRRSVAAAASGADTSPEVALLLEAFQRAHETMETYFPDYVESSLRLYSYWADMQLQVAKDIPAARSVWENLIKSKGWMVEAWQGYIDMEVGLGNLKEARALYRRCYSRRLHGSGTQVVCEGWLRFEREKGTLEDYDHALLKVTPRLAEVRALEASQEAAAPNSATAGGAAAAAAAGRVRQPKGTEKDSGKAPRNTPDMKKGRKRGLGYHDAPPARNAGGQPDAVHGKRQKRDAEADSGAAKVGGGQVAQKGAPANGGPGREEGGERHVLSTEGRGGADQEQQGAEAGAGAGAEKGEQQEDHEMGSEGEPRSPNQAAGQASGRPVYKDECTAFVSNIELETSEGEMRELFSQAGTLRDIRMARERFTGRFRGFAYVEFETEEAVVAAVEKFNRHTLRARQLSVKRSDPSAAKAGGPPGGTRGDRGGGGSARGRGQRGGARRAAEGSERGGRGGGRGRGSGYGQGSDQPPAFSRRGGHVQLSGSNTFAVPRNVRRTAGSGRGEGDGGGGQAGETPKSNVEFRAMLFKK